jgi:thermitase
VPSKIKVKSYSRPYKKRSSHLKQFIIIFTVALILITVPLTVRLAQEQQEARSNAARAADYKGKKAPGLPIGAERAVQGQILVKVKNTVTDKVGAKNRLKSKHKGKIKKTIPGMNVDVIEVAPADEQRILSELKSDPDVEYAEPDYIGYGLDFIPNDPRFKEQYGLNTSSPNADIDAPTAWDTTKGLMSDGQPVKVAILDTGIDPHHPDLAGTVILEANFVPGDTVLDEHGHGTHVAGIIAAQTNNNVGVAGTCPSCVLLIGKVLGDETFRGQYSWFAEGIKWAADNNAKVINMSLGGTASSRTLTDAVAYANKKGAVVVAAAGNCGVQSVNCEEVNAPWYPANTPDVVGVAATDSSGQKAVFSNHGMGLDVAAPGASILSTYIGDRYANLNGTSMATPYTAGTLALIFAKNGNISPQAATSILFNSADPITGTGNYWKYGKINAGNAVSSNATASDSSPTTGQKKNKKQKKNKPKKSNKNNKKKKRGSLHVPVPRTFSQIA